MNTGALTVVQVSPGDVVVLRWGGPSPEPAAVLALLEADGDASHVAVFNKTEIAPVGLVTYLAEGHGIDAGDLAPWQDKLEALEGVIVVISARAFEGKTNLTISPPAHLVAEFREAEAEITAPATIETESAKGNLSGAPVKKPKSDARIGGMVAMAVLLFLAIFVTVFVVSAG